jgi:hypothetical protein
MRSEPSGRVIKVDAETQRGVDAALKRPDAELKKSYASAFAVVNRAFGETNPVAHGLIGERKILAALASGVEGEVAPDQRHLQQHCCCVSGLRRMRLLRTNIGVAAVAPFNSVDPPHLISVTRTIGSQLYI